MVESSKAFFFFLFKLVEDLYEQHIQLRGFPHLNENNKCPGYILAKYGLQSPEEKVVGFSVK